MIQPTKKEVETTIGKVTVRAMRKGEFDEMRKLERKMRREKDEIKRDELNDEIESYYQRFMSLEKGKKIADIEMSEYASLINDVNELSRNVQKN